MPPCEGGYKNFKIGELFNAKYGDKDIQAKHLNGLGINVVSSGTKNNGIVGKTDIQANIFPANTITIDMFGNAFFQSTDYKLVTHARVFSLALKSDFCNEYIGLYFVSLFHFLPNIFSYNNMASWEKLKDMSITLPTTSSGDIDFAFMESRIRELEEERMRELEAYLAAAGFANCTLTPQEQGALRKFNDQQVIFKQFTIGDLFEAQTGDVDLQQKDINGLGTYFINSGIQNCGIKGKTDRKARIFPTNSITIDFFGNAYYRPFEYKLATHNHVFSLQCKDLMNENRGLYWVCAFSYLTKIYSFNNMGTWSSIKAQSLTLPTTPEGEIDYDFMETYISAVKKQTIAGVKNFIAREHRAYEQVIHN